MSKMWMVGDVDFNAWLQSVLPGAVITASENVRDDTILHIKAATYSPEWTTVARRFTRDYPHIQLHVTWPLPGLIGE